MNKTLRRIAFLFLLVCASVCLALTAVACNNEPDNPQSEKVTYSVTVSAPAGLSPADIKAQWLKGSEAASDEIALNNEGKATVELEAGDYKVTLKGVPGGYIFSDASVTADNRDATIAIIADSNAATVNVSVKMPAGFQTAFTGILAQIYKGEEEVGAGALSDSGSVRFIVPRDNGTYVVRLTGLPDYLGYSEATVQAGEKTVFAQIQLTPVEIEYTVNIDTQENIDGATVTFYKDGEPVEGATELPIQDKQVKKSLVAGNYTAKFNSANLSLNLPEVALTYTTEGRVGTLTVAANIIAITLDKPANITTGFDKLTVVLEKAGVETGYFATPNEEGVAYISAPRDNYGDIIVRDETTEYPHFPVVLQADGEQSATVKLAVNPKTEDDDVARHTYKILPGEGRYFINVSLSSDGGLGYTLGTTYYILRTTGDGPYYSVRFDANGADGWFTPAFDANVDEATRGELSDNRNGGTAGIGFHQASGESRFQVEFGTYVAAADMPTVDYILTVEKGGAPSEGFDKNLAKDLTDGENSVDASMKAAWFKVPKEYSCHKIEFAAGISVTFIMDVRDESQNRPLTSGSYFRGAAYESSGETRDSTDGYLYVESADGNIKFTLTEENEPGSTPGSAIDIELGNSYTYTFTDTTHITDKGNRYYCFTPTEEGRYVINVGSDVPTIRVFKYNGDEWSSVYGGFVGNSAQELISLQANTKYLFVLSYTPLVTTFSVEKHIDVPGEKGSPIEVSNVGETPTTVTLRADPSEDLYLYHKVTEESLNEDGNLVFDFKWFGASGTGLVAKFYQTAGYNTLIKDNGDYELTVTIENVKAGDTIYFTIRGYSMGTQLNIYVNKPAPQLETLKLGEPVSYTVQTNDGDSMEQSYKLDANIVAGNYKIAYFLDPDPQMYGKFVVKVGEQTFETEYGLMPAFGELEITIAEGDKTITFSTDGHVRAGTYTWRFKLREVLPVLKPDGEPVTTDIATSGVDINAPAGRYKLTYTFNADSGQFQIAVGGYTNTAQANVEAIAKIEIVDITTTTTIIWQNDGGATGTVTFKLEAIPNPEIEAGTPLPVTFDVGFDSLRIKLKNVSPAKYELKIEVKDESEFTGKWTIQVGEVGGREFTSAEQTGLIRVVAIEIPLGADGMTDEIILKLNSAAAKDYSLELTLTKAGDFDTEVLELDSPYDFWISADRTSWEIPIEFATEDGVYNISLDFSIANAARNLGWYVEVNGVKTAMVGDSSWYSPVDVYIPANIDKIIIGINGSAGQVFKITATVTKVDASLPGVEKAIVVGTEWGYTDFTTYFAEAGDYKITISGDNISQISIKCITSALGVRATTIVKQGTTEGKFTVKTPGTLTLRIIDGSANGGMTVNVLIQEEGVEPPPEDNKLIVGTEKTINITSASSPVKLEIELEAADYEIKLTGADAEKVAVKEQDGILGARGEIVLEGNLQGEFRVTEAKTYTLIFEISDETPAEVTVLVSKKEGGSTPPPEVGVPFTVEFTGTETESEEGYSYADKTFIITLEAGSYDITIEGDTTYLMVTNELGDSLVYRTGTTGVIEAEGGEYTLIFRYYGISTQTPASFTVTVTKQ